MTAVLLDVGGTLWSERWPPPALIDREAFLTTQLCTRMPALPAKLVSRFVRELPLPGFENGLAQDTDGTVLEFAKRLGLSLALEEAIQIRKALCVPAYGHIEIFPGVPDLLRSIRALGMRSVLVSNAVTRDGELYLRDFADFGLGEYLDAAITSIDVGFLKPHPAIFAAALQAAGCPSEQCAMVGNSEVNDIIPAKELGMFAVRVCIEEPPPASSVADAVATSLDEVRSILHAWHWRGVISGRQISSAAGGLG